MVSQLKNIDPIEPIRKRFLDSLSYLSDPAEAKLFAQYVFSSLSRAISHNKHFYEQKPIREEIYKDIVSNLSGKTHDNDKAFAIVQKYIKSSLGIFDELILLDNAVDIFIVSDRVSIETLDRPMPVSIYIPDHLQPTYEALVDNLRTLTHYASSLATTKFDPANPILDYEVEGLRFNVAHPSLNALRNNRPIIAIRHQVLPASRKHPIDDSYIKSLKLTENQLKTIQDLAYNKSFIVIGATGSGKTTLLRYMGNHKLEDKRNLVTIEDTPELFLPVNITYLTNDNYTIQDLFKVSLRENPSHVIVGETRSDEIVDILESSLVFNTGTTVHAGSFSKLIMRIVFMVKAARPSYATEDITALINATMDGVVLMRDRKVAEVWKKKKDYSLSADVMSNFEKVK